MSEAWSVIEINKKKSFSHCKQDVMLAVCSVEIQETGDISLPKLPFASIRLVAAKLRPENDVRTLTEYEYDNIRTTVNNNSTTTHTSM